MIRTTLKPFGNCPNSRRRQQLIEQIREHITLLSAEPDDFIKRVIRAHVSQTRFALLFGTGIQQSDRMDGLCDDVYVLLLDERYFATVRVPSYPEVTIADVEVELEDAATSCKDEDGRHYQHAWAAVLEMRRLLTLGPPAFNDGEDGDTTTETE